MLNALAVPGSAMKTSNASTLIGTAEAMNKAVLSADAKTLLDAVKDILAAEIAIEATWDAPLTAAESRLRAALGDPRTIYVRDKLVITAVAVAEPAVLVVYDGTELTVALSEGSKVHRMIDVAIAALGPPKKRRGEFALHSEDDRVLAETVLARGETDCRKKNGRSCRDSPGI